MKRFYDTLAFKLTRYLQICSSVRPNYKFSANSRLVWDRKEINLHTNEYKVLERKAAWLTTLLGMF